MQVLEGNAAPLLTNQVTKKGWTAVLTSQEQTREDVAFQSPFPILIGSGSRALLASSPHPQVEDITLAT